MLLAGLVLTAAVAPMQEAQAVDWGVLIELGIRLSVPVLGLCFLATHPGKVLAAKIGAYTVAGAIIE